LPSAWVIAIDPSLTLVAADEIRIATAEELKRDDS
jgi:hypothetical protein